MNKALLSLAFLLNAFNGSAEDTWKSNPNWLVLPSGKEKLGNMHGDVATSSNGDLYLSVGDAKAGLQVYGDDGTWKRNLPNAPSDLHGFVIRTEGEEEFIYGARVNAGEVLKMTLEGKTVLKITASSIPDEFKRKGKNGKPLVRLTGADVAQNGDVFVTDGYSSDPSTVLTRMENTSIPSEGKMLPMVLGPCTNLFLIIASSRPESWAWTGPTTVWFI